MKKLIYAALALCVVCMVFADDHIIQFVLSNGKHVSFRTSDIQSIRYDYHDQDSIDKAYVDSVRAEFVKDSLYQDSLRIDSLKRDSIGRHHTVGYQIDSLEQYTIFTAALKLTGLYDSLNVYEIRQFELPANTYDINGYYQLYCPTTSRNGFTLFAETDSVMKANGINSLDDLTAYANRVYGNADKWYDYLAEKGLKVSTGTDYTSPLNALNMFVAYHILKSAMPVDQLVYERNSKWMRAQVWNYCNDGQPYDYYETMLPHTLMKIWQPQPLTSAKSLYINRYVTNNTLTDEAASYGSAGMHVVVRQGVRIDRDSVGGVPQPNVQAYNGYIHSIQGMLVYDQFVPRGALHERMRFDFVSQLPEMNNNGWRFLSMTEASALNGGGSSSRLAFPNDYFENIRVFDGNTLLRYNIKGAYNAYMSDAMLGWGRGNCLDLAVKLPALPSGEYEVRLGFSPMAYGGIVQFYLGDNPSDTTWIPYGIPFDLTIPKEDPRIGWTNYLEEEDLGIESDKKMRNLGYMRGPYSFKDHPEYGDEGVYSMRSGTRNALFRKILGNMVIKQTDSKWLRIKNVTPEISDLRFLLDFIEFVPIDVVGNQAYMEDWY